MSEVTSMIMRFERFLFGGESPVSCLDYASRAEVLAEQAKYGNRSVDPKDGIVIGTIVMDFETEEMSSISAPENDE